MNDENDLIHKAMPRNDLKIHGLIQNHLKLIGNPSTCRSCDAPIWWILTKNNKKMPLNNDLTSHFSSCPQSREWRKNRQMKKDGI